MASDVLINIFDELTAAQRFAREKLGDGFDVTVTGDASSVAINQQTAGRTTAVSIDDASAKYVVLSYNQT